MHRKTLVRSVFITVRRLSLFLPIGTAFPTASGPSLLDSEAIERKRLLSRQVPTGILRNTSGRVSQYADYHARARPFLERYVVAKHLCQQPSQMAGRSVADAYSSNSTTHFVGGRSIS